MLTDHPSVIRTMVFLRKLMKESMGRNSTLEKFIEKFFGERKIDLEIEKRQQLKRKKWPSVLASSILIGLMIFAIYKNRRILNQCYDSGGEWNFDLDKCEFGKSGKGSSQELDPKPHK